MELIVMGYWESPDLNKNGEEDGTVMTDSWEKYLLQPTQAVMERSVKHKDLI